MTRFVVVAGPNTSDEKASDYLYRLDRAVQAWLLVHGVDLPTAMRAGWEAANHAKKTQAPVVYLTAVEIWRYVQWAKERAARQAALPEATRSTDLTA